MAVVIRMPQAGAQDIFHNVMVSAEDEVAVRSHKFVVWLNENQNDRLSVKGHVEKTFTALSHFLIGKPPDGHVVDHINNSTLDNTRANLRHATFRQNSQNRVLPPNESGYRGVHKKGNTWSVRCNTRHLGSFSTAEAAARHYDAYAVHTYGSHAKRNFPDEEAAGYKTPEKKARKEELPTGVQRTRETERFVAVYSGRRLGSFDTPAQAGEAYQQALHAAQQAAQKALLDIPVDWDKDGVAILPVYKGGELAVYMKCDPELYHELLSNNLNLSPDGYVQTRKANATVLVHRFVIGAAPGAIVDHINRCRTDNRRSNLRIVTASESLSNTCRSRKKKSNS